jgi:hypothetical protein
LRKTPIIKDGLSESSIIILLQRVMISNLGRLYLVLGDGWADAGEEALSYLRKHWPILVGGHAGAELGTLRDILCVCFPSF